MSDKRFTQEEREIMWAWKDFTLWEFMPPLQSSHAQKVRSR